MAASLRKLSDLDTRWVQNLVWIQDGYWVPDPIDPGSTGPGGGDPIDEPTVVTEYGWIQDSNGYWYGPIPEGYVLKWGYILSVFVLFYAPA